MNIQPLFKLAQKEVSATLWSKGVELSRSAEFIVFSETKEEAHIKVQIPTQAVSSRVILYIEDEAWSCDCNSKDDPCKHVAATLIALKNNLNIKKETREKTNVTKSKSNKAKQAYISYEFTEQNQILKLTRFYVTGSQKSIIQESLTDLVAGIQSGRIDGPSPSVSKEELGLDFLFKNKKNFRGSDWEKIFKVLSDFEHVYFNDKKIKTRYAPVKAALALTKLQNNYQLKIADLPERAKLFYNEAFYIKDQLVALTGSDLTLQELNQFKDGMRFGLSEAQRVFDRIIPLLKQKIEIREEKVETVDIKPELRIETLEISPSVLEVVAKIVYGNPPMGEVRNGELTTFKKGVVINRNISREQMIARDLKYNLNMLPGMPVRFKDLDAIKVSEKIKSLSPEGDGIHKFEVLGELLPTIQIKNDQLNINFSLKDEQDEELEASLDSVIEAYDEGKPYVRLLDGGFARLPENWLNENLEFIKKLISKRELSQLDQIKAISRFDIKNLEPTTKPLASLVEHKQSTNKPKNSLKVKADLRPYQVLGHNWLNNLKSYQLGAVLADDMGLGKTLQTISVLEKRSLVIAPTSVLYSWSEQIEKFAPYLSQCIFHGSNRKWDSKSDIVITSYGIVRSELQRFLDENWNMVVVDEAQNIKNYESQTAQSIFQINSQFRIALSGTPIENHLSELWSIYRFALPDLFEDFYQFKSEYIDPINKGNAEKLERLRKFIKPFFLRRLKTEVAKDLPSRTEVILHCELNDLEKSRYQALVQSTQDEIQEKLAQGKGVFEALELLLRLRQACCDIRMLDEEAPVSTKTELLLESLENSIENGHRCLVFSQWTTYLDLIERELKKTKLTWSRLDGSSTNRQKLVEEFQDPNGPNLMLISLKAGGTGLTLTKADHVYIVDPWWNPAAEDQAADRAHRIGQKNPVLIHRLVAKDTVEERILALQNQKRALAKSVLEGHGAAQANLTREDILSIFK